MAEPIISGSMPALQLVRGDGRPVEPGTFSRRKALAAALAGTALSVAALALPVSAGLARRDGVLEQAGGRPLPARVATAQMHQIAQVLA